MSLILKWPLYLLIIIIGSLVTFYTLIGGTKAKYSSDEWAESVQFWQKFAPIDPSNFKDQAAI